MPAAFDKSDVLYVGVAAPARAIRCAGVAGRKIAVDPSEVVSIGGLRVTTPERTWCDLAAHLSRDDLVAAGDFFIRRDSPLASLETLRSSLRRHPSRRGRPTLVAAVPLLDAGAESRQESILRLVLLDAGLGPVKTNVPLRTRSGQRYRADLLLPDKRTILEYQSEYHADLAQFRDDMTRRSRLEADGWTVIYINADDLRDTGELADRLRTLIATRGLSNAAAPHAAATPTAV